VKCPLSKSLISDGMSRDEDLQGKITNLKYMDHEITDAHKFPELERDQYLCTTTFQET
jgi:hypothetical protein